MAVVYQPNHVAPQTGPQPPIQVVANQPATMVLQSPNTGRAERYNAKSASITGWLQLTCAIAAFVINILELLLGSTISTIGTGIWGGLLILLSTGILGIISRNKSTNIIFAYMVMSVISAITGFVIFCMGIAGVFVSTIHFTCNSIGIWNCGYHAKRARFAFDAFFVFIGLVELVVAIVAACYCFGGVCCGQTNNTTSTMVYQHSSNVTPVVMMVPAHAQPSGQPVGYPQPPPVNQPQALGAHPQGGPGPQPGLGSQPNYNMGVPSAPPAYTGTEPLTSSAQPVKV